MNMKSNWFQVVHNELRALENLNIKYLIYQILTYILDIWHIHGAQF